VRNSEDSWSEVSVHPLIDMLAALSVDYGTLIGTFAGRNVKVRPAIVVSHLPALIVVGCWSWQSHGGTHRTS
jgi:hypothetical protein